MACDCSKPKPGPHGTPPRALVASGGSAGGATAAFTHVDPTGARTSFGDLLGARAAAARRGGAVEIS